MADRLTLNMIATGLRAGLTEARAMVGSPAAALAVAEQLLREDPAAVADFSGDAGNLAGWLLNESRRSRQVDAANLAAPDADPTAGWLAAWDRSTALRDEFQGDRDAFLAYCRHEHRQGRNVPEAQPPAAKAAEVRVAAPVAAPARAPEHVAAPPAKLAQTTTPKGSARLSLADAGTALGLPLDSLPKSAGVVEAFRSAGLRVSSSDGIRLELDSADVERLASDPAAVDALLLRLTRAVPSLNHVGGGAIAFR